MISVKADLLGIKSLGAVNVCDGHRDQFEFHLHGSHGCFPLSVCLTVLLFQVYPERRTESTLLSTNMLEEERARKDEAGSARDPNPLLADMDKRCFFSSRQVLSGRTPGTFVGSGRPIDGQRSILAAREIFREEIDISWDPESSCS
jgi:hypothetical protein